MGSRVELYSEIRRAARVEGLSVNALAKRFRVHRRTGLPRVWLTSDL